MALSENSFTDHIKNNLSGFSWREISIINEKYKCFDGLDVIDYKNGIIRYM